MPAPPPPIPTLRKATHENLTRIVEMISEGHMRIIDHAQACACSPRAIRTWLARSNNGDPDFEHEFFGERMQFAKAVAVAKRFAYLEMRGRAEQYAIHGRKRRTLFQGDFVFARDPAAVPLDRETRILCGYHPDALLLDQNGHAVYVEEEVDPPIKLIEAFFSTFPDLQKTTNVNQRVSLNGQLQVGAQVIPRPDYAAGPPPIPAAPTPPAALPMVEVLPDPVAPTPSRAATDDELASLLGDPVVIAAAKAVETIALEPEQPPAVAPAQRTAPTPPPASPATEPDSSVLAGPSKPIVSDLQRDLLAKLAAARSKPKDASA